MCQAYDSVLYLFLRRSESASKPSVDAQRAASPPAEPLQPNVNEVEKLRSDLGVVVEQVKLCREMLNSPGIKEDEALSDVVGFLEACRDRLVDIVEAGAQGILGEELFEFALKVNDAVSRTLEAERVRFLSMLIDFSYRIRITRLV